MIGERSLRSLCAGAALSALRHYPDGFEFSVSGASALRTPAGLELTALPGATEVTLEIRRP